MQNKKKRKVSNIVIVAVWWVKWRLFSNVTWSCRLYHIPNSCVELFRHYIVADVSIIETISSFRSRWNLSATWRCPVNGKKSDGSKVTAIWNSSVYFTCRNRRVLASLRTPICVGRYMCVDWMSHFKGMHRAMSRQLNKVKQKKGGQVRQ